MAIFKREKEKVSRIKPTEFKLEKELQKLASSELMNQSLYYLHWISDHKGDFQVAVNKALKNIGG